VHINKSFQLGAYEVTLGQFKKFLIGAERSDLLTDDFTKANSHGDKAAVSQVSWNDAHLFVNWLNKKEGGNHYRLPSEAEWEYAARAGTTTIYSWGNSPSLIDDYAWYASNAYDAGERYAHAVGKKQPNPWGLYDMQGNLWEWVQDNWHDNYDGAPLSGSAWVDKNIQNRVDRGGSWGHDAENLRSAVRGNVSPDNRNVFVGFRILRQP
jgi:formylglycine-generating enzyme required for sulfatase activity